MRFLLFILLINLKSHCVSQVSYYSCGDMGEIIESNSYSCSTRSLGNYIVFGDIAITPDGRFYGITDRLYEIDTNSQTTSVISSQLITNTGGLGLIAIDNDKLLYDKQDSLFIYEISTNTESLLGAIGYYCNGDFAFLEDYLYMVTDLNELIRIEVDFSTLSVISVDNIGYLNSSTGSAYSLFTAFESCLSDVKSLFIIDGVTTYQVNKVNAQLIEKCNFYNQQLSYGSASIREPLINDQYIDIPNVFTPNGDGVNDEFKITYSENIISFEIVNRWGNLIYSWNHDSLKWSGETLSGDDAIEGVYFYIILLKECNKEKTKTGHITLLR